MARVATGLDRIAEREERATHLVRGRRIGLVAHPASIDSKLNHARDVLLRAGANIAAIFGPEHGFGGEAQDMIGVGSSVDPVSRAPVHSLYGSTEEALTPTYAQLSGLDAIVIDLQDVGTRYYTFVWTAALVLRAAARAGVHTIVLDRPNPLGGVIVEGAPQSPEHRSFVGLYDVAVRHAMTIGELCEMVRAREAIDVAALTVVSMRGWRRVMTFDETELPWVLPSPNMPTLETVFVYPGGCLIEGTNLSEGRGTTRPFEILGAPWLDGVRLAQEVAVEGAVLRPLVFEPTFQKHAKTLCGGVQLHVRDRARFRSFDAYAQILAAARRLGGERFGWRTDAYEFVKDKLAIDLLSGGAHLREAIDARTGLDAWRNEQREGAREFEEARKPWLAYS